MERGGGRTDSTQRRGGSPPPGECQTTAGSGTSLRGQRGSGQTAAGDVQCQAAGGRVRAQGGRVREREFCPHPCTSVMFELEVSVCNVFLLYFSLTVCVESPAGAGVHAAEVRCVERGGGETDSTQRRGGSPPPGECQTTAGGGTSLRGQRRSGQTAAGEQEPAQKQQCKWRERGKADTELYVI